MPLQPKQDMGYYTIDNTLPIEPKYRYRALMDQTTTGAPTPTILSNNLGTIVWTRLTDGQYQGTLASAFPELKTAPLAQQRDNNGNTLLFRTGNSTIALQTSIGGAYLDNLLVKTYIEINIYE